MDYLEQLNSLAPSQQVSIQRYHLTNHETVWIRKATQHHAMWRYHLLAWVIKPFKLGVLTPVPNLGGEKAIATEKERLIQLNHAGIHAPKLLAYSKQALMMSDLSGISLHEKIEQEAQSQSLISWKRGIDAIAAVHQKKQFLSQSFARNMQILPNNQIAFLDFEDNPLEVLSLIQCQCRDWLCYLHSTALILQQYHLLQSAQTYWLETLDQQPSEIQQLLWSTITPVRFLRFFTNPILGRDTLRLAALIQLFKI